ncbi:MAG: glycosyltransferase family 4 protein [Prevotella sp.]|nr:glycosyltransferase family 4 protein [Prevotella sp.]
MTKNVLVDFSHLADLNGFGEIARNYAPLLAKADVPDIHLIYIVPDHLVGQFGTHIDYIRRNHKRDDLKKLDKHIDLWHATDQQFHLRGGDSHTIQLLTVHDLNFLREKSGLHRWRHIVQLWWRMRRSDHLTCISQYAKNDVMQHYNLGAKVPDVIYNGIASHEDEPQQRPAFVTGNEPFFFTIGQIREKKNFQTLVPMMHHFPTHKLYICGDDHFAFAQKLRRLIDEKGEGRVVMTGKIRDEEKRWLYAHTQAFLFPSRLEGFGIPVLEAMRFRCKVFSSRFSSLPEVCANHASYFDDYAPEAMAATIKQGLSTWQSDGEAAIAAQRYSQGFSYERYTQQYISLYVRLLKDIDK